MTPDNNITRKTYLDILRLLATFAVVISHICASPWYDYDAGSREWLVFNFYNSVSRWGVPVFLMISGTLFLNSDRSLSSIYKKYILRIVVAFLFWSFIYACISFGKSGSFKDLITSFISGHYHMLYLFLIVGIYMTVPILRKFVADEKMTYYFLFMALIFAVILPQSIQILRVFSESAGDYVQGVTNKINMFFFCGFTICYIGGYVLDNSDIKEKEFRIMIVLGFIGFISTIILNILFAGKYNCKSDIFNDAKAFNVLLESIPIFVICKKVCVSADFKDKTVQALKALSKYSFGVYLVHPLLIEGIRDYFHISVLSFNPVLSVPIMSTVILVLSYSISALLHRIPYLNRYIV